MLNKEDKKLRLKIEIIGIIAVVVLLGIIILVKGVKPGNQEQTTTEVTAALPKDVIAELPENAIVETDAEGVEAVVQEQPVDVSTSAGELASVENSELNTELAETDIESLEIAQLFLVTSGLSEEFNPVYSKTTYLSKNLNNWLDYKYIYRVDDTISKGRYSDLHIEITKDINDVISEMIFMVNVQDDMQVDATLKANIANALSSVFESDLSSLSTMNGPIDFTYKDDNYTVMLTSTVNYSDDYNILYYTVKNKKEAEIRYDENKNTVSDKLEFKDITKKVEISLDDDSINTLKTVAGFEKATIELVNASVNDSTDTLSKELVYNLDNGTLTLRYSNHRVIDKDEYFLSITTSGKTQDELKEIGKNIAKEVFGVDVMESYKENEEEKYIYVRNNEISIRIVGDSLEIATANSVYDFNNLASEESEEQIQPEIVVDPETMEVTYVYPDIETKTDEEMLEAEKQQVEQEQEDEATEAEQESYEDIPGPH